jgi:hypothetical protein
MFKFETDPLLYIAGPEEERAVQCFLSYLPAIPVHGSTG